MSPSTADLNEKEQTIYEDILFDMLDSLDHKVNCAIALEQLRSDGDMNMFDYHQGVGRIHASHETTRSECKVSYLKLSVMFEQRTRTMLPVFDLLTN